MRRLLIAIIIVLCSTSASAGIFDRDTTKSRYNSKYGRPNLLIKTSVLPLMNWRSAASQFNIGAELCLFEPVSIDGDIGMYYRLPFVQNDEFTKGFFVDGAIRFYPRMFDFRGWYIAPQYRFEQKDARVEFDFSEAGLPYSRLVEVNRNSHKWMLMLGANRSFLFDRLFLEYSFGFGLEHRVAVTEPLPDYEIEAIETGDVEAAKWDDENGKFAPTWHFDVKIGIKIF